MSGLRDRGLLESAVLGVNAGFEDVEKYPTTEEKVARLAFAPISTPFADGNKRVGVLAMLMILKLNGVAVHSARIDRPGLAAASGKVGYGEILGWVRQHTA